jgi:hypothetical protein
MAVLCFGVGPSPRASACIECKASELEGSVEKKIQ